jgi:hypothetical protein
MYRAVALVVSIGFVLGLLLILLAVRGHQSWREVADAFLAELGVALVVAAFLAATIDIYLRYRTELAHIRQQGEISENIFKHLFGFGLHRALVDELTETIFASKIRRDAISLSYEFWTIDADLIGARLTVDYHIINSSRGTEKYQITHYFENTIDVGNNSDTFTSLRVDGAAISDHYSGDALHQRVVRAGIRRILTGPIIDVPPDQPIRIHYTYETVRRRADSEVWITTLPTNDLKLTIVLLDDSVRRLAFAPDASHRNEPELVSNAPEAHSALIQWKMQSGLLPYQGIVLYWCPSERISTVDPGRVGGAFVVPLT